MKHRVHGQILVLILFSAGVCRAMQTKHIALHQLYHYLFSLPNFETPDHRNIAYAIEHADLEGIKRLLAQGAQVNYGSLYGPSLLNLAQEKLIDEMIKFRANPQDMNTSEKSLSHQARKLAGLYAPSKNVNRLLVFTAIYELLYNQGARDVNPYIFEPGEL